MSLCLLLGSCQKEELQNLPKVFTRVPTDISLKSATLQGEIIDEGYSSVSVRGFVYSNREQNPSLNDLKVEMGPGKGLYTVVLDNLLINTKYYYKAFATNLKGTSYGEPRSFTTSDYALSSLTTDVPKSIGYTTVNLGGVVTNDGGGNVTERGFVVGENPTPTILDLKFSALTGGLGAYSLYITTLRESTKYYVRAYAVNEKGVSYANTHNFTTADIVLPTVITEMPLIVTSNSARISVVVANDGGSKIKEVGICYGLNPNPTISDSKIRYELDLGTFTVDIRDLRENSTYYVRSYAVNSKGLAYGNEQSFKTLNASSIPN
jgi:FlaG/FlaF family flagellin (archaellin)